MADVVNDIHGSRLVVTVDGATGELAYRRRAHRLILVHTEVPPEISGRGGGGALVRGAVAWARDEGLTLVPRCPFAARWLKDHPDVSSTVPVEWTP